MTDFFAFVGVWGSIFGVIGIFVYTYHCGKETGHAEMYSAMTFEPKPKWFQKWLIDRDKESL